MEVSLDLTGPEKPGGTNAYSEKKMNMSFILWSMDPERGEKVPPASRQATGTGHRAVK